ncbi:amidase [Alteromonas sp. ZYF713]|nr:amidase [Alteromonas sp. ZYF713]
MSEFIQRITTTTPSPVTVAVKDCLDVAGLPTTCGSAALADSLPATDDAEVVKNLRRADVEIVGKTNLHELAYGMTGVNQQFGTPLNPLFPHLITGGSSSGSAAAVASGEVTFSVGTDTGGSIRVPAACCGVAGLKPTFGRISRQGVTPASSSLDAIGPMASDIHKLELGMSAMDPGFTSGQPIPANLRLAQLALSGGADNDAAIERLLTRFSTLSGMSIATAPALSQFKPAFDAALTIMNFEVWQSFAGLDQSKLGKDVAARLQNAARVTTAEVDAAEQVRSAFTHELDTLLEQVDVLFLPALPGTPMQREAALRGEVDLNISLYTRPFNLCGHPALVMPLSGAADAPLSIQLVTRKNEDELLFAVARQLWEVEHNGQFGIGE